MRERRENGAFDSEGHFSVSGQEALTKLAEFQLPFAGAWALKLVQAAVCGAEAEELCWTLTAATNEFTFAFPPKLGVPRIESAFSDPYPQPETALNHLITGLRAVGLNEKRPFRLETPAGQALSWDGQRMVRGDCRPAPESFRLEVSTRSLDDEGGLFGMYRQRGPQRNADVTNALSERAFPCPISLELDGRRLDALELSPGHGYGPRSQPMGLMACSSPELTPIPLPQGTRSKRYWSRFPVYYPLQVSASLTPELEPEVGVAFLVSLHYELDRDRNTQLWEPSKGRSRCYWVLDGVVVDEKPLEERPATCSVGCFLSAVGLKTDLSSLTLRDSQEAQARLDTARSLIRSSLKTFRWDDQAFIEERSALTRQTGVGALVGGLAALWVHPLLGVLVGGLGLGMLRVSRDAGKVRAGEIKTAVEDLISRF